MTEEFFARVLVTLVDCGVKSMTILVGAWLITLLIRQSAATRHLIWQTAFVVLLFLPLLDCFVPSFGSVYAVSGAAVLDKGLPQPDTLRGQERLTSHIAHPEETTSVVFTSSRHDVSIAPTTSLRDFKLYLMKGMFILWLGGVVIVILWSMLAYLAIINLRRCSMLGTQRRVESSMISARVDLKRKWELRTSTHAQPSSAMTWGIFRPIVLLPQCSLQWSEGLFEAVLLHELAHVRRRDSVTQLLIEVVCALYWCNPLAWICARAIRAEAELAADDLVLHCGVKGSAYAAELLRLTAAQAGYQQPFAGYGLSIVNGSPIEARIRSIVEPHYRRRGANLTESTAAIVVGLLTLLLIAPYRSIGFASSTRGPIPSAKQTLEREENLSENHDGHIIDFRPRPERLFRAAHEKVTNEIQEPKVMMSNLRIIENQADLRQKHESSAPDSVAVPADISESESAQQSTNHKSISGQTPDRINWRADPDQKEGASGNDVLADPNGKDGDQPSPQIIGHTNSGSIQQSIYDKRGADLISPDSPLPPDEEQQQQRHRRQQLDVVSPDLLPGGSQPPSAKKGVTGAPTYSPDMRPASP